MHPVVISAKQFNNVDAAVSAILNGVVASERRIRRYTCMYCGLRRYHLPGEHNQCDHSPTGDCVDPTWNKSEQNPEAQSQASETPPENIPEKQKKPAKITGGDAYAVSSALGVERDDIASAFAVGDKYESRISFEAEGGGPDRDSALESYQEMIADDIDRDEIAEQVREAAEQKLDRDVIRSDLSTEFESKLEKDSAFRNSLIEQAIAHGDLPENAATLATGPGGQSAEKVFLDKWVADRVDEEFEDRWQSEVNSYVDDHLDGAIDAEIDARVDAGFDDYYDGLERENPEQIKVSGKIVDEKGEGVAAFEREINLNEASVYHASFFIDKAHQGSGIARDLLGSGVAFYDKIGIQTVTVDANGNVGKYAWAMYGFDFADDGVLDDRKLALRKFIIVNHTAYWESLSPDQQARIEGEIGGLKHSWDIARYRIPNGVGDLMKLTPKFNFDGSHDIPGYLVGKASLLNGTSWNGVLTLDKTSTSRQILNEYLKKSAAKSKTSIAPTVDPRQKTLPFARATKKKEDDWVDHDSPEFHEDILDIEDEIHESLRRISEKEKREEAEKRHAKLLLGIETVGDVDRAVEKILALIAPSYDCRYCGVRLYHRRPHEKANRYYDDWDEAKSDSRRRRNSRHRFGLRQAQADSSTGESRAGSGEVSRGTAGRRRIEYARPALESRVDFALIESIYEKDGGDIRKKLTPLIRSEMERLEKDFLEMDNTGGLTPQAIAIAKVATSPKLTDELREYLVSVWRKARNAALGELPERVRAKIKFIERYEWDTTARAYSHKFSSTQVDLPDELQKKFRAWVDANVKREEVYPGEEVGDDYHVTIKYGLHTEEAGEVEAALDGYGPIKLTLGRIVLFTTNPDYDVLVVEIDSADLARLNEKLSVLPHTDTHPGYVPHATLAYLKKGVGAKWVGDHGFDGEIVEADTIKFSPSSGDAIQIRLVPHSYHLQGEHDQCDHSPSGECVDPTYKPNDEPTPKMSGPEPNPGLMGKLFQEAMRDESAKADTLYHGTSMEAAEYIQDEGLIARKSSGADAWAIKRGDHGFVKMNVTIKGRDASVFMTPSVEAARQFATYAAQVTNGKPVIVEIELPPEMKKNLKADELYPTGGLRFEGNIPPKYIKAIRATSKWIGARSGDTVYAVLIVDEQRELTDQTLSYASGFDPVEAMNYLAGKSIVIKGIIDDDLTRQLRLILLNYLKGGQTQRDAIQSLRDSFEPFIGDPKKIAPSGPLPKTEENILLAHRLENIIRTETTDAMNEGRLAVADAAGEYVVGFSFSAILDGRETEWCGEADGINIEASSPLLPLLTPPLWFNCRSILTFITTDDLPVKWSTDDELREVIDLIPDGFNKGKKYARLDYHLQGEHDQQTHAPLSSGARARVEAEFLYDRARLAEPGITPVMENTARKIGGKLRGLKFRVKGVESIEEKISSKIRHAPGMTPTDIMRTITDPVRYTIELPDDKYAAGVVAALNDLKKRGFVVEQVKNYWQKNDAYDGINVALRTPGGLRTELQFHTPASYVIKETKSHPVYEALRKTTDPKKAATYVNRLIDLWRPVSVPVGVMGIGMLLK